MEVLLPYILSICFSEPKATLKDSNLCENKLNWGDIETFWDRVNDAWLKFA